jgi:branched-chain amino acid transport system ATP-binding protein
MTEVAQGGTGTVELEVEGLSKRFGGVVAVDSVSFRVERGEIFGLIGPNGAGKTTCFNMVSGAVAPTEGKILYRGQNVAGFPAHKIASLGIGRTFQHTSTFGSLTVRENVLTATFRNRRHTGWGRALVWSRAYRREQKQLETEVQGILEFTNLSWAAGVEANGLPYGDQRRLEVAIALGMRPSLLLLDEPAAGMNPAESREFVSMLGTIRDQGITVILVEHDMKVVMNICDRIHVLSNGKTVAEGTPEEVRNDAAVVEVYLGSEDEDF